MEPHKSSKTNSDRTDDLDLTQFSAEILEFMLGVVRARTGNDAADSNGLEGD